MHQIEDADLLEATDETIKELLFNYLEDSIVEFEYRCDKSLEFEFPYRDSIKLNVKDNKAIINNITLLLFSFTPFLLDKIQ